MPVSRLEQEEIKTPPSDVCKSSVGKAARGVRWIDTAFKADGFSYVLVKRFGDVAVFSQAKGLAVRWETVIIQRSKPHPDFDTGEYETVETYPKSRDWGLKAWTFFSFTEAVDKAIDLFKESISNT